MSERSKIDNEELWGNKSSLKQKERVESDWKMSGMDRTSFQIAWNG